MRSPFDPMQRIWERLQLSPDLRRTTSESNAVATLTTALEAGKPAIVWADRYSLPYRVPGIRASW